MEDVLIEIREAEKKAEKLIEEADAKKLETALSHMSTREKEILEIILPATKVILKN